MNPNAMLNRPPINSVGVPPKLPEGVCIKYNARLQLLALHHRNSGVEGPMFIHLTKLETASQILYVIATVDERIPELTQNFVCALNYVLLRTFRFSLYEIGRGRNGPRLCWRTKKVYAR